MKNKIKSESILKKRIRKFKSIKRGYYSLIILISMFIFSLSAPLFVNDAALIVKYNGKYYFPFINKIIEDREWLSSIFKLEHYGPDKEILGGNLETKSYRLLQKKLNNDDNPNSYVIMPLYPYAPVDDIDALYELDEPYVDSNGNERYDNAEPFDDCGIDAICKEDENWVSPDLGENDNLFTVGENFKDLNWNGKYDDAEEYRDLNYNQKRDEYKPTTLPNWFSNDDNPGIYTPHILGTDNNGNDVFAKLVYGFKISFTFALIVWAFSYTIGIIIGAIMGYFGGKLDLFGMRIIEVYGSMPFLFILMILATFMKPNVIILALMYVFLTGWIGISWYIRGEFLREKSKDYVAAAVSLGQSHLKIMFKHILPNALTPIVTFAPFAIIGYISALVSLDYLGFGLGEGTPSWGEVLKQGGTNPLDWHLIVFPLIAMAITLFLITLIGEAVRAAFDPKVHSRLR